MLVADLYHRVSTTKQLEEGTSLQSQEKSTRSLAAQKGFTIGEVFSEDWPGSTMERPKLTELRQRIRNRQIQAVICHATDRLARNPIHLAIIAEECEKAGVELVFVTEPLDNSPEGQLIRYVKGFAAQIEREKIRERTVRGKRERALKGKLPLGGMGLYGYTYIRGKEQGQGVRVVNEDEATVVRMIFQWMADDMTLGRIAVKLSEMGIPTPKGKRDQWGRSTVSRILSNEAYLGKVYANKYQAVLPSFVMHPDRRYKLSSRALRPQDEWIAMDGTTPGIIDERLFDAAQAALRRHAADAARNEKHAYLLGGHITCGLCGRKYRAAFGKGHRYYRCMGHDRVITLNTCTAKSLRADDLEAAVWDQIKEAMLRPETITSEVERRLAEASDDTPELLQAIDARLKKAKDRENRLIKLYAYEEVDEAMLQTQLRSLKKEREGLEAERKGVLLRVTEREHLEIVAAGIKVYCEQASANIEGFSYEDKKDTIDAVQLRITITPERIYLQGILPLSDISSTPF